MGHSLLHATPIGRLGEGPREENALADEMSNRAIDEEMA